MDDGAGGAFSDIDNTIGPSTFFYDITAGLTVGLDYRFKVIAKNDVG